MMVIFLHDEYKTQFGVMSLSAILKQNGYSTDVFVSQVEKRNLVSKVVESRPDVLAVSAMTPGYSDLICLARLIKSRLPRLYLIVGGPHSTFFPEIIYKEKCIDAICRGEGEDALLELVSSLRQGQLKRQIPNLWIRDGETIVVNDTKPFIQDLDTLPFADREIYSHRYPDLVKRDIKFMIGRGCPFDCTYCFNAKMKEVQSGKWTRFFSAERIINEIEYVQERYPMNCVSFIDDTFNIDAQYLQILLEKYKKKISMPFLCRIRIDLISEDQIDLLKEAGVERITVGIEHGNEEFREKYLNRKMSNAKIEEFGKWMHERNIRLITNNIIGFPHEDLSLAFDTIDINVKLKPEMASMFILNPYPGTKIYEYLKRENLLSQDFSFEKLTGHHTSADIRFKIRSFVKNKYINQLYNLKCFIMVMVIFPWLKSIVKLLIKLPPNPAYELAFPHFRGHTEKFDIISNLEVYYGRNERS